MAGLTEMLGLGEADGSGHEGHILAFTLMDQNKQAQVPNLEAKRI